ncbi:hypothetical protein C8R43DRAFT_997199 [Mycena crocata]|nr:hypothetical protein C8R43DRAFT_997199 [Mycena crocata]
MDINMADVDMDQYKDAIEGPKSYDLAARGWTAAMVQRNHKDYVIKELTEHPDDCIAAIVITSDFLDRARAADAVKAILKDDLVADSDKVAVYPAIPKEPATGVDALAIMPLAHILTNCTAAFKLAIAADPVFHGVHEGAPTTFYCIPARPPTPFIFAVFVGFIADATDWQVKTAVFTALLGHPDFLQMVKEDHSNISGDLKPELALAVAIHWGTVSKCTVHRGGGRNSVSLTAHRIMIAPISKDDTMNLRFQQFIMNPGFIVDAQQYGEGRPWFRGPATSPEYMSCYECHGIDHYKDFCPIINSKGYRDTHGITEVDFVRSSIPTSLLPVHDPPPTTNQWSSISYRGGGRGRGRGGPRGRGGGYNDYSGGNTGYNGRGGSYNGPGGYSGYNGGYNGGGRGRGGGGNAGHGYNYKPYNY